MFHGNVTGCFIWDVPATLLGRTKRRCHDVATTSCCRVGRFTSTYITNNNIFTNWFTYININSTNTFTCTSTTTKNWTNWTSINSFTLDEHFCSNEFTCTNKTNTKGFTWKNITITNGFTCANGTSTNNLIMGLLKQTELRTGKIRGNWGKSSKFKLKSVEHTALL